jgi:hypothetical protein
MKIIALPALALLAACAGGADDQAQVQADQLDNAAEQSTPEAAATLENQADAIRDNGAVGSAGAPGSTVQNAVNQAGQAQKDSIEMPAPGPKPTQDR